MLGLMWTAGTQPSSSRSGVDDGDVKQWRGKMTPRRRPATQKYQRLTRIMVLSQTMIDQSFRQPVTHEVRSSRNNVRLGAETKADNAT
jgi:hypothetical protein